MTETASWPDDIFRVLRAMSIQQVAYVPDAGHTRLIELCRGDNAIRAVGLTTEEDGVALLAGAWLGGQRGALLMQSSGIGNCINMLSLITQCRFPLLSIVTMRGQWGEFNPWQIPMGQHGGEHLSLAGTTVYPVRIRPGLARPWRLRRGLPSRVASRPQSSSPSASSAPRLSEERPMSKVSERFPLRRRAVVEAILADRGDMLVVAGLGSAAWDITSAGDHPLNFPMWGAMGGSVAFASARSGAARAADHRPQRRRRPPDGARELRHRRRAAAGQSGDRRPRQRALRRDRHAGDRDGVRRRPRRDRTGLRLSAHRDGARPRLSSGRLCRRSAAPPGRFFTIKIRAEKLPWCCRQRTGRCSSCVSARALLGEAAG